MQQQKEVPALVKFEYRSVEDRAASIKEGHYVGKDVIFAMITPKGGNLTVDKVADEWLASKKGDQFYDYYAGCLKAFKEGEAEPEIGTAIRSWPVASPSQVAACHAANIKTVEDLATAPAQALTKIGMGSVALQQKAVAWLQSAQDHGKLAEQVATLSRDNDALATRNADLEKRLAALEAAGKSDKKDAKAA